MKTQLTGAKDLGKQMGNALIEQVMVGIRQRSSQVPDRAMDIVVEEITAWLDEGTEPLFDQLIPLYAKYYSEDDLDALITFYETPTGRKVIATMPALIQELLHRCLTISRSASNKVKV